MPLRGYRLCLACGANRSAEGQRAALASRARVPEGDVGARPAPHQEALLRPAIWWPGTGPSARRASCTAAVAQWPSTLARFRARGTPVRLRPAALLFCCTEGGDASDSCREATAAKANCSRLRQGSICSGPRKEIRRLPWHSPCGTQRARPPDEPQCRGQGAARVHGSSGPHGRTATRSCSGMWSLGPYSTKRDAGVRRNVAKAACPIPQRL